MKLTDLYLKFYLNTKAFDLTSSDKGCGILLKARITHSKRPSSCYCSGQVNTVVHVSSHTLQDRSVTLALSWASLGDRLTKLLQTLSRAAASACECLCAPVSLACSPIFACAILPQRDHRVIQANATANISEAACSLWQSDSLRQCISAQHGELTLRLACARAALEQVWHNVHA